MDKTLENRFVEAMECLALITHNLTLMELCMDMDNRQIDLMKLENLGYCRMTNEVFLSKYKELHSEYSAIIGMFGNGSEINPICSKCLINEIENNISNISNGQGFINRLMRRFYRVNDVLNSVKGNDYKGGEALSKLSAYWNSFIWHLNELCVCYGLRLVVPLCATPQLPKELDTPEAKGIFTKAVEVGLIEQQGEGFKWLDTKELLAYFCQQCSLYLNLRKGKLDKDGNKTISWKPFESLFNTKRISSGKDSWLKLHTTFHPANYQKVDSILN